MEHPLEEIVLARNELPLQWADDYRHYRIRTTRKLARLRKSFNLLQRPVKGKKPQRSGKAISLEDVKKNAEVLKVYLTLAERAWAEALRTTTLQESTTTVEGSHKKDHIRSKLAKAATYAARAVKLAEEVDGFDDASKLELYAYSALISGHHDFVNHRWKSCIKNYSVARASLFTIANKTTTPGIKEQLLDVISTIVDEHITYSVFQLEKVRPLRVDNIAKKAALDQNDTHPAIAIIQKIDPSVLSIESLNPSENNRLEVVTWRKHTAKITDDDVAAALFDTVKKDSELEAKVNSTESAGASISLFDGVLQSWQDTQDLVKDNIKRYESSNSSHDQSIQDQYIISTFAGYSLLLRRIQRDTILLSQLDTTKKKEQTDGKINRKVFDKSHDLVRIYDTILQSTNQLLELPGIYNDEELLQSLTSLDSYYKAKRIDLIGQTYFLAGENKEALALYQKALGILTSLPKLDALVEFPQGVLSKEQLNAAISRINIRTVQLQAVLTAEKIKLDNTSNASTDIPAVVDSIKTYPSNLTVDEIAKNLVKFDQKLEPVFVKPVFFDIAFNYVDYDNDSKSSVLSRDTATASESSDTKGSKRGFLKGLWGR
ncbi:hypothetical protein DV495_002257 [Geotrichum candidum]|nr:hypothetical protein DV452_001211 [Geotrichum candidum]KAF5129485.1 hypothetical protein DV495_002257 [Geotrichum candidum]KAI9212820.1 hypothetical protein DS838_002316 [Geotrichum bryndzae]